MPLENRVSTIAIGSVFGALAATLTIFPLDFPFPLLPYLRFDVAEIPIFISFMIFGPLLGFITSVTYLAALLPITMGEWLWPVGPFLKFIAVVSQVVGLWLGYTVYSWISRISGYRLLWANLFTFGAVLRIVTTTISNYLILEATATINYAGSLVALATGLTLEPGLQVLIVVLLITAVFNAIHTPLSMIPAIIIVKRISSERLVSICPQGSWLVRIIDKSKTMSR